MCVIFIFMRTQVLTNYTEKYTAYKYGNYTRKQYGKLYEFYSAGKLFWQKKIYFAYRSCTIRRRKMALINLNLDKSREEKYTAQQHFGRNYEYWREYRQNLKQPFAMVPSEIVNYTSEIKTKALSLYLYYCYMANNKTGKSWAAIETIAAQMDVSTKSINNWNSQLEELGLIYRVSEGRNSKTTYVLPVSSFVHYEKVATPEQVIEYSKKEVDGELIGVFHLFQWRKEEGTDQYVVPYNVTCLAFQRRYLSKENPTDPKEFVITKAVLFEEEEYKEIKIDQANENFSETTNAYLFETEERHYAVGIPTHGVAVTSKINLKETKRTPEVIDFVQQLVSALQNETLDQLPIAEIVE